MMSAYRILRDFNPTSSASAPVAQLQLETLQSRRTSDKVCMMYKIMNSLVDVNPTAGLLEPRIRNSMNKAMQEKRRQSIPTWTKTRLSTSQLVM